jgi:hypothetical protein
MLAGGNFVFPANSSSVTHVSYCAAIRSTSSKISRCGRLCLFMRAASSSTGGILGAPSRIVSWLIGHLLRLVLLSVLLPRSPVRVLVISGAAAARLHSVRLDFHSFPQPVYFSITSNHRILSATVPAPYVTLYILEMDVINQRTQPPWEFLLTASRNTLQSYELSRLSHASNLRKEISSLLDQWLDENANAMVARWLIEQRERSVRAANAEAAQEPQPSASAPAPAPDGPPNNGHSVSDNFLTERLVRPHAARNRG